MRRVGNAFGRLCIDKCRVNPLRWFFYKLHLIADTKHELPAAFSVERTLVSERKVLPRDMKALFRAEPMLVERHREFSADQGYD